MKWIVILAAIALGWATASSAGAEETLTSEDLTYLIDFPDGMGGGSSTLADALNLVESLPSRDLHVRISQPPEVTPDFFIEVGTSAGFQKFLHLAMSQGQYLSPTADAFTTIVEGPSKRSVILVRLMWDRIMLKKENGLLCEREDAFSRLLTALGHEIYGNVRTFHSAISGGEKLSSQIRSEVAAFQAGIDFIDRAIEKIGNDPALKKTAIDLQNARGREAHGLATRQDWGRCNGILTIPKSMLH